MRGFASNTRALRCDVKTLSLVADLRIDRIGSDGGWLLLHLSHPMAAPNGAGRVVQVTLPAAVVAVVWPAAPANHAAIQRKRRPRHRPVIKTAVPQRSDVASHRHRMATLIR
jgi:hypothetical protein